MSQQINQQKFKIGDKVGVNENANGDSAFVFRAGVIEDYINGCYGVLFKRLSCEKVQQYRRFKPYKLTKVNKLANGWASRQQWGFKDDAVFLDGI